MMDVPDWVARAKPVTGLTVEVGFLTEETFYYGPENDISPEQWAALRKPLYQPDVPRHDGYVLTGALVEAPEELVKHYADVVRLLGEHGKWSARQPHYFWLRPILFAPEPFAITFPWYDAWDEAEPVLDALEAGGEGVVFDDVEQGWEVVMFIAGGRLFIRQGNFDTGAEEACVCCEWEPVARQIPALRARCHHLLGRLRSAFGRDYWSSRPGS